MWPNAPHPIVPTRTSMTPQLAQFSSANGGSYDYQRLLPGGASVRSGSSLAGHTNLAGDRRRTGAVGQKRNLAYLRRLPQSRHSTRNLLRPSLTSLFVDHVLPHLERPYLASQPIRIAIWGGLVALQSLVVLTQGIRRISVRPTHIHETGDRHAR